MILFGLFVLFCGLVLYTLAALITALPRDVEGKRNRRDDDAW